MRSKKKTPKIKKVVILVNPSREHTRGLLSGIAKYANMQSDWVVSRPVEYRLSKSRRNILPVLEDIKPDGILMREPKDIKEIINLKIPTVSFTYSRGIFPQIANVIHVITDNAGIGKMGAEHLLKLGLQKFAFCGFDDWWWSRLRGETFAKAVAQAGYETYFYKLPRVKSQRTWDKELPIIADWLGTLPKPIGLLTCNDDRGELAVEASKMAELRVPDDIAVVGVDNDKPICDLSSPPLSSIVLNVEKIGYEAAFLLNKMMRRGKIEKTEMYIRPIRVVERQSTDVLAVDDPEVAEAIRYIRRHATDSIGVDDVVAAASLSRRVIEKRFRKVLKHSVHDEIRRARIERIIHLLSETRMSISQIAQTMSFPSVIHLSRYFRRGKGVSPAAYRKKYVQS